MNNFFMKGVLRNKLICLKCGAVLSDDNKRIVCPHCQTAYQRRGDAIILSPFKESFFLNKDSSNGIVDKLKNFFKKFPSLYKIFYYCFGSFLVGKSIKSLLNNIPEGNLILNLGSGFKIIRKDVINVDSFPFKGVDVVADIKKIPFLDDSVDFIICDAVLEHIDEPDAVIKEMSRVLRPGGLVYVTIPFIFGFHSCPEDYYRWTESGLRARMKDFCKAEVGVCVGPSSAMVFILSEWLAIILSFGIKRIYESLIILFLIVLSPLKLLDFFYYKYPPSKNIAAGFYFIGYKQD